MKKKEIGVANICFTVQVIGNGQVGISVTGASRSSNRSLLGKAFFVSDEFPYSKVYPDKRGFDGLDYTFLRTMVFDEADIDQEFNARIDVEGDKIVLRAVTQAHFLDNVLKMRQEMQHNVGEKKKNISHDGNGEHSSKGYINPLAPAFEKVVQPTNTNESAVNAGGTSDGGTCANMPPDNIDERTSKRITQPAPRKPKATKCAVGNTSAAA